MSTEKSDKAKRAEILFFYDARMSNPNGDPDENRPRIDRLTGKNLVTEFRLKRTVRDYLYKVMDEPIFMRRESASSEGPGLKYLQDLASEYIKDGKISEANRKKLISENIDIQLFGILFAVGNNLHFKQIGPVQFSIGQSLNKVEEVRVGLVRIVPNTGENAQGGTFGEKYLVRYSFIEFHGFVNNYVAEEVDLLEEDIKLMLIAMWKGTDSLSTSSKIGQKSRLLIKVNYKEDGYIGDLDLKCKLETDSQVLQDITQTTLNVTELFDTLGKNKDILESIEYEYNSELRCKNATTVEDFGDIIKKWSKEKKMENDVIRLNLYAHSNNI